MGTRGLGLLGAPQALPPLLIGAGSSVKPHSPFLPTCKLSSLEGIFCSGVDAVLSRMESSAHCLLHPGYSEQRSPGTGRYPDHPSFYGLLEKTAGVPEQQTRGWRSVLEVSGLQTKVEAGEDTKRPRGHPVLQKCLLQG